MFFKLKCQINAVKYSSSYNDNFLCSAGAVCHELGHLFDLPHDPQGFMSHQIDLLSDLLVDSNVEINLASKHRYLSSASAGILNCHR